MKSAKLITPAEVEVLDLLSRTNNTQEIADCLQVSTSSVYARLQRLYKKASCRDREKLLAWSQKQQLLISSDRNSVGRLVDIDKITPSENKVLDLLCKGLSTSEIAKNLSISIKTVETHLSSLFRKTGNSHRASLLVWGLNRKKTAQIVEENNSSPALKQGQLCQVKLYKNINPNLEIYNNSLVFVLTQSNRGVLCTSLSGEFISDIFYRRELLPLDESEPIKQTIKLTLEDLKKLSRYGRSPNEAIANLLNLK